MLPRLGQDLFYTGPQEFRPGIEIGPGNARQNSGDKQSIRIFGSQGQCSGKMQNSE